MNHDFSGTTVITGASGHVGGNLARALVQKGVRPRVLVHRDTRAIDGLDVERVGGDVLDGASLGRAFEGAGVVYHLAAHISIDGAQGGAVRRINVQGTRNVVEACLRSGVRRLVHFSSIHAISQFPRDRVIDENNPPSEPPRCHEYDFTKAEGERLVREGVERGLDAVILNPTGILGPHDYKPSPFGQVLLDLFNGRFPALVGGGFNWVDVRDVVEGAVAAVQKGRRGERYILSGHYVTLVDLAKLAEEISGAKAPRFTAPLWLAMIGAPFVTAWNRIRGGRPLYTTEAIETLRWNRNVSCAKAEKELGYRRKPIRETLEDTYRWFKEAGKIR
jgi:dihydroflavonol-4-reductase